MQARIYKPAKSAMQSGVQKQQWVLEYNSIVSSCSRDKLMGWSSSSDMVSSEVKLRFPSLSAAEQYAKDNNINYELVVYKERAVIKKQYSDNFTR